jgi:hypothetical protein
MVYNPGMSEAEQLPPPRPSPPPARRRIIPITPDRVTAGFTVVLAIATLALVATAILQHFDTVDAVEATKRLAIANENAANDRRETASAEFAMKIDAILNESRYDAISSDIDENNSNFHLPKYPNKADADVDEYIGIFEDIGYFVANNLIGAKIAYERFSYDIEKAWCNVTVQQTIRDERASDKSKTAQSDPEFGNFEKLAKEYLATDGLSCNDLDSPTASAAAKKKKTGVRR